MEPEEENQLTNYNISDDDEILILLNKNCNENEKEMFIKSYNLYKLYKNNKDDYIIDLDNIWQWLGFSLKANAKRQFISKFKENIDYIVFHLKVEKSFGRPKEQILMNVNTFKKFCMVASTTKSTERGIKLII